VKISFTFHTSPISFSVNQAKETPNKNPLTPQYLPFSLQSSYLAKNLSSLPFLQHNDPVSSQNSIKKDLN